MKIRLKKVGSLAMLTCLALNALTILPLPARAASDFCNGAIDSNTQWVVDQDFAIAALAANPDFESTGTSTAPFKDLKSAFELMAVKKTAGEDVPDALCVVISENDYFLENKIIPNTNIKGGVKFNSERTALETDAVSKTKLRLKADIQLLGSSSLENLAVATKDNGDTTKTYKIDIGGVVSLINNSFDLHRETFTFNFNAVETEIEKPGNAYVVSGNSFNISVTDEVLLSSSALITLNMETANSKNNSMLIEKNTFTLSGLSQPSSEDLYIVDTFLENDLKVDLQINQNTVNFSGAVTNLESVTFFYAEFDNTTTDQIQTISLADNQISVALTNEFDEFLAIDVEGQGTSHIDSFKILRNQITLTDNAIDLNLPYIIELDDIIDPVVVSNNTITAKSPTSSAVALYAHNDTDDTPVNNLSFINNTINFSEMSQRSAAIILENNTGDIINNVLAFRSSFTPPTAAIIKQDPNAVTIKNNYFFDVNEEGSLLFIQNITSECLVESVTDFSNCVGTFENNFFAAGSFSSTVSLVDLGVVVPGITDGDNIDMLGNPRTAGATPDIGAVEAQQSFCRDADADSFGNAADCKIFISETAANAAGFVADATDCDDTKNTINTSASEVCSDNLDNDCDGNIDENCSSDDADDADADGSDDSADADDSDDNGVNPNENSGGGCSLTLGQHGSYHALFSLLSALGFLVVVRFRKP